jgi:hypothetical protein
VGRLLSVDVSLDAAILKIFALKGAGAISEVSTVPAVGDRKGINSPAATANIRMDLFKVIRFMLIPHAIRKALSKNFLCPSCRVQRLSPVLPESSMATMDVMGLIRFSLTVMKPARRIKHINRITTAASHYLLATQ